MRSAKLTPKQFRHMKSTMGKERERRHEKLVKKIYWRGKVKRDEVQHRMRRSLITRDGEWRT